MSFVSARELEAGRLARKEQQREMREEILREAKESFEKEKKREELKRARGDDTWILPAVKKRLGFKGEAFSSSEKKKKKKKKDKKHKKHKKSKTEKERSESEKSEAEEDMWVEKGSDDSATPSTAAVCTSQISSVDTVEPAAQSSATLQREEWMTMPLGPSDRALSIMTEKKREEDAEQRQTEKDAVFLDKPGQHPRELNPFWKDGGAGLPSNEKKIELTGSSKTSRSEERQTSSSKHRSVGDRGQSWLLRAYKRAIEQAKDSGRSLEEIATERWGSLAKLYSLLNAAGIDPENPDAPPRGRGRRDYLYSRTRKLDEDRERRSVDEFDQRQDRNRRQRDSELDRPLRESGERRRDFDRDGERDRGERREEWSSRERYRRKEGDIEKRKRNWKESFQKPQNPDTCNSADDSGFLKPGDLDQSSSGVSLVPQTSSVQGWRKKKPVTVTTTPPLEAGKEMLDSESQPIPSSPPGVHTSLTLPQEDSVTDRTTGSPAVAVPAEPVTETQLNSLGAKLMKAELVGNSEKVEKLKKELERLQEVKKLQENASNQSPEGAPGRVKEERTLVLTKTDRFGREKPLQLSSTKPGYRPTSKGSTHTKKGKREKYFHDDDNYSLKELVEQERMMTAEETHAAIAQMASKFVPAAGSDETVDDVLDSKKAMRYNEAKELEKARKQAVTENRKMADAVEKCQLCFDNQNFNKHLLVAVGMNTYLCAPWHTSLTEGHCYIVPMEHITCSMYLDENIWSEIEIFRKGLTRMFADRDLDVVFMETYTSVKRRTHMYIDCIPVPREEGALVPMYFKKAILESDEEWAQNKKLIDTKEKGVRGSLPTGLPYFFAEFGVDGGFGHIIEDTDQFPHYFGREVIGGLLDLDPRLWLKPRREDFDKQKAKVLKLSEWWSPYDWTQKLKE